MQAEPISFDPYTQYAEIATTSPPPFSANRPTREKPTRGNTYDMKSHPNLPTIASGLRLGYYPTSLLILGVWLVFLILLVWLLESAVRNGPRSLTQPWSYTTLPSLLITVFAQGHGAITAMHLARVSVSALHSPRTSPNTWAEVFWISDRAWQGPVGIFSTVVAASRLRVRTSTHFILCAVTCLTALVTPIILSRAYPIRSISVSEDTTITPFALDMTRMGAVDGYAEIGTGVGSWTTALSVADTYNTSVYLPPGASRTVDPTDFFFAGNIDGKTATLPGLRLSGQCTPVASTVTTAEEFPAYCQTQMQTQAVAYVSKAINLTPASVNLTMRACVNASWENIFLANPAQRSDVAYIFIDSKNATASQTSGISVVGMIRCDTSVSTGRATLSGANGTFSGFTEEQLYKETQAGEPLLDPLFALIYYLDHFQATEDVARASVARALGFVGLSPSGGIQTYTQPSLQEMATGLWRGVSYVVTGLGLLSRTNEASYAAVQSGLVAVHIRERSFAIAAYVLLAVWLLLLILITARSFRPTFGGSFDSYVTAKLVLDKPGLVESSGGELATNARLREPFGRVGRDDLGRVVVAE
ncbi:hypothetical protein C8R43DRAFT_993025 [Mycena crocata]|nr:hypothetical protein C8R43DRAFT_993025 [Mycena crocata]